MVTLLYHAKTIGHICKRFEKLSDGKIQAFSDRANLPYPKVEGTIIRWDSRARLRGDQTINTPESVSLSRNKRDSRVVMEGLCPPTWFKVEDLQHPCLIRPSRHYGAQNFFVCKAPPESIVALQGLKKWYASPLINKQVEYRVFIFQGYCLKVVRRFHKDPTQVAWNAANGGSSIRIKMASWPIDVINKAILAGERLGLGWYAADIIVDQDGTPYVLELNTAPGIVREKTIENFVKAFSNPVENPNRKEGLTWKDLIHPNI